MQSTSILTKAIGCEGKTQNMHVYDRSSGSAAKTCVVVFGALLYLVTFSDAYEPQTRFKIAASVAKSERRAMERQAQRRVLCERCSRPPIQCVCDCIPSQKIPTSTDILILQHPTEFRRKTFSTVPLIPLVLKNVRVHVGHSFDPQVIQPIRDLLERGQKPLLLFPDDDAVELSQLDSVDCKESASVEATCDNSEPKRHLLIVVDGTWTQVARMLRNSPELKECCQKVAFTASQTSLYDVVRKEPHEHCLSTLEACSQALLALEPASENVENASKHLHAALQKLVDRQLYHSQSFIPRYVNRDKAETKVLRRKELEEKLFGSTSGTDTTQERVDTEYMRTSLVDGGILRRLSSKDIDWVDDKWPFRSEKTSKMLQYQMSDSKSACCSLGIEHNGALRACILRYINGSLGMLYVDPDYRRRGYALVLLNEACRIIRERGEPCEAYIVDGNEASKSLFRKAGWEESEPGLKGGTGKRKAKRKWIRPGNVAEA